MKHVFPYFVVSLLLSASLQIITAACADAKEKNALKTTRSVRREFGQFNIDFEYAEEDAWAGNERLNAVLTIQTLGKDNLQFVRFESDNAGQDLFEKVVTLSKNDSLEPGILTSPYDFALSIRKDAAPRIYNVRLRFAPPVVPGQSGKLDDIVESFPLNIGVRDSGLLEIDKQTLDKPIVYTLGSDQTIRLRLINHFQDYPVNIEKIEVTSEPDGLVQKVTGSSAIEGSTIIFHPTLTIDPGQRESISIPIKMAPASFSAMFDGFFDTPLALQFSFIYNDGHGRKLSDFAPKLNLKGSPSAALWIVSMLLGVVIGTVLKLLMEQFQMARKITMRVIAVTVLIGVVVTVIVWIGHIQVLVWNFHGSYENPVVIWVISLISALIGPALLSKILKTD